MNTFFDWKDKQEDPGLNEALRARLNSSADYLKHALGADHPMLRNVEENPPTVPHINENLQKDIQKLEEKIQNEIAKAKQEPEITEEDTLNESEEISPSDDYKLYRDREETFECNISIEGASLATAQARIIIDTSSINLIFYGKLYKDGKCKIPLKKMNMYEEGTRGQIRLEVVVDDTVFTPWESSCVIEGAKRVSVDVKQKKNVSVNFGETTKS
jgi:hypothetical protein